MLFGHFTILHTVLILL